MDGLLDEVRCLAHLAGSQILDDRSCLLLSCLAVLLRVNGFADLEWYLFPDLAERFNLDRRPMTAALRQGWREFQSRIAEKVQKSSVKNSQATDLAG